MPEECDGIEQCCDGTWFQYAPCCPEPEVSAGPDQEIEGLEGAFAGQADNYDSVIWTQISGPEVEISTPSSLISTFTFSEAGTAIFELSATNTCGTVSGRVSIISISVPESCCLYPVPGNPESPIYPYSDLPLQIVFVTDPPDETPWDRITPNTVETTNAGFVHLAYRYLSSNSYIAVGETSWLLVIYDPGDETYTSQAGLNECLIDPLFIEDLFPETYTATWEGDTAMLTRESICSWSGVSENYGASIRISYEGGGSYFWFLEATWPSAVPGSSNTPGSTNSNNSSGQSSPAGLYVDGWDYFPPGQPPTFAITVSP